MKRNFCGLPARACERGLARSSAIGAYASVPSHHALPRVRQGLRPSKWVRAKVSISAQFSTSSEVRATPARAADAGNGNKAFLSATKWLGGGTEKRADLSLVSYPKIIFSKL